MDRIDYEKTTIQEIITDAREEKLNLNPWYQRRSVWTRPQKAYLINTILEKKAVPSLYIRHSLDLEKEKSIKEVVDGQQRIRSIIEYVEGNYAARHPNHPKPIYYEKLSKQEKQDFRMTSLSVGYLLGATDSDVIDMFGRLNSVNKTLNVQEKRNAKFSGEFKQFCLGEAAQRVKLWRELNVFTANDIARMSEVQFVSELAINIMYGLTDYSVKQIDDTYAQFDEDFERRGEIVERFETVFSKIASLPTSAITDTIFSRQPLFFTLFIILDSIKAKIRNNELEDSLHLIDEKFNSDVPIPERSSGDIEFYVACTSSPHRIKSRRTRDEYVRERLIK